MARTAHTSYGVHQAIASMTTSIRNISGDRELSSVWTTAIRPLVLYSDPGIAASTDRSTLHLDRLQDGERPSTLYLCAPSPRALTRLHPLYRVILEVLTARLTERKVRQYRWRLLKVLDEAPAYGYCAAIDQGMTSEATYGHKSLVVIQDLDQFHETFGVKTPIWGNCDCKVFHAPANDLTAKRLSDNLLGKGTVSSTGTSRSGGMGGRQQVSTHPVGRPLLTPDELMDLDKPDALVRVSGCKPLRVQKVDYRTDALFAGRW
jgi:type IV secretion system protein VirD4